MGGIAPHIEAWGDEWPEGWDSVALSLGPSDLTYPVVELLINGQWTNITQYVRFHSGIRITRGKSSESSQVDPSTCSFTVDNRDGRFSPRNPTGAYYGHIGRNTPIRVSVVRNGVRRYRFHGEVSSWPVKWDITGNDSWTEIDAAGLMRRLSQGSSPLRSSTFREMTYPSRTDIKAYWPMEDGEGSSTVASGMGGKPMTVTGTPNFAAFSDWPGSDSVLTGGTATLKGVVPSHTATGQASVHALVAGPSGGVASTQDLLTITTTGTARTWRIALEADGDLQMTVYDADNVAIYTGSSLAWTFNTTRNQLMLDLTQSGSDINFSLQRWDLTTTDDILDGLSGNTSSSTIAGRTFGRIKQVVVGAEGGLDDTSIGHLAVSNSASSWGDTINAIVGWRGESPRTRIVRLCREEGVSLNVTESDSANTTTMGAQGIDTLLDLLRECADTDLGLLYETRDQTGLGYTGRGYLYNRSAQLELDYAQHELSDSLDPVDDDRYLRNDVTVVRDGGSSARAVLEEGALSIADPPDGAGRYDESVTLSLGTDGQLENQAYWRLFQASVDEARYPSIALNLRHESFTSDTELTNRALSMDVGDRVTVSNPPAEWSPDTVSQLVIGYRETISGLDQHSMELICAPESAYHVAVADADEYARADAENSSLTSDITSSATSVSVTTDAGSAVWVDSATYSTDFPFDVRIGGEVMTVTAVTGTSSPQTFTVTRSVNGVTKAHTAGTEVRLAEPTYAAL